VTWTSGWIRLSGIRYSPLEDQIRFERAPNWSFRREKSIFLDLKTDWKCACCPWALTARHFARAWN